MSRLPAEGFACIPDWFAPLLPLHDGSILLGVHKGLKTAKGSSCSFFFSRRALVGFGDVETFFLCLTIAFTLQLSYSVPMVAELLCTHG